MKKARTTILIGAVIFSVSVIFGIYAFSVFRDALALGKDGGKRAEITLNSIDELAGELDRHGIVDYPLLFSMYAEWRGGEVLSKTATVSADMDYRELLSAFTSPPPREVITLNFPAGSTTDEMIDILVEHGIGTREGFIKAIEEYPFEYDFIDKIDRSVRKYRLDGYLYPDIYEFYTGRAETYYIYKLLDRFDAIASRLEIDDKSVITASKIQGTDANAGYFEQISSVIYNREKSGYDTEIKMANPGKDALLAAIYPAKTGYKYFHVKKNGEAVFASTEKEHAENVRLYS